MGLATKDREMAKTRPFYFCDSYSLQSWIEHENTEATEAKREWRLRFGMEYPEGKP